MHATRCDFILDAVQNAVEAGAERIRLVVDESGAWFAVRVEDDGRGMDGAARRRALDPFFTEPGKHPGRRVGLGLPFIAQAARLTGGSLDLASEPGRGTTVEFRFGRNHVDTPPAGDLPGTLLSLFGLDGAFELEVERRRDGAAYRVTRSELAGAVGGWEEAGALALARAYLRGLEEDLNDNESAAAQAPAAAGCERNESWAS